MDIDLPGAEPVEAGPYMSRELKALLAEMKAEGRDIPRGQLEPDVMPDAMPAAVPPAIPPVVPAPVALPVPEPQKAAPAEKPSRKESLLHLGRFLLWFFFVFGLTFTCLYLVGAVPDVLKSGSDTPTDAILKDVSLSGNGTDGTQASGGQAAAAAAGEEPQQIIIASIGVNAAVLNPATIDTDVMDADLQHGAVRYPGSGLLGGQGNIFLFGHSTGFKIVNNQAYKTFNNIKTLKKGDKISVFSKTKEYVYSVDTVTLVDADKALVDLSTVGQKLTLSTCNTFGEKQERHVVEATFVSSSALPPAKQ